MATKAHPKQAGLKTCFANQNHCKGTPRVIQYIHVAHQALWWAKRTGRSPMIASRLLTLPPLTEEALSDVVVVGHEESKVQESGAGLHPGSEGHTLLFGAAAKSTRLYKLAQPQPRRMGQRERWWDLKTAVPYCCSISSARANWFWPASTVSSLQRRETGARRAAPSLADRGAIGSVHAMRRRARGRKLSQACAWKRIRRAAAAHPWGGRRPRNQNSRGAAAD